MGREPSKVHGAVADVARSLMRVFKDRLGRGPDVFRAYLIDNMIMIRLLKVLNPVEHEQAKTLEGQQAIKAMRKKFLDDLGPSLEDIITASTGAGVVSTLSDLSVQTGEAQIGRAHV